MDQEVKYALILCLFFVLSLIAAIVLFSYMESYAIVEQPSYRLGGAAAGFLVVFVVLFLFYTRLIARPASDFIGEAAKVIDKPKKFIEFKSNERGFSLYYPRNWKLEKDVVLPPVFFHDTKGVNLNVMSNEMSAETYEKIEKDPLILLDLLIEMNSWMYKNWKVLEKGTIALHGKQCPTLLSEKADDKQVLRQFQIAYPDRERERMFWITWTCSEQEFEHVKPTFQKITSTFHPI